MGIVISENYFETNNLALLNFQEYTIPNQNSCIMDTP